jgi:hypothetical protein
MALGDDQVAREPAVALQLTATPAAAAPECVRLFSLTGGPTMPPRMLTRQEAGGQVRLLVAESGFTREPAVLPANSAGSFLAIRSSRRRSADDPKRSAGSDQSRRKYPPAVTRAYKLATSAAPPVWTRLMNISGKRTTPGLRQCSRETTIRWLNQSE